MVVQINQIIGKSFLSQFQSRQIQNNSGNSLLVYAYFPNANFINNFNYEHSYAIQNIDNHQRDFFKRFWQRFKFIIQEPIMQFLSHQNAESKKIDNLPYIKEVSTRYKHILLAGNGGDACYITATLNALRAYFANNNIQGPSYLKGFKSAIHWAISELKSDTKYGKYFSQLEDTVPLLFDYDDSEAGVSSLVPSIILRKVVGENFAQHFIVLNSDEEGYLFNPEALKRFIIDTLNHKISILNYAEGPYSGHLVTIVGFKPGKNFKAFIKILDEYIATGKHLVSLKKFVSKAIELMHPEFDIGSIIIYDQSSDSYNVASIPWLLLNNYQASATTIDSQFSHDKHSRDFEDLTNGSINPGG